MRCIIGLALALLLCPLIVICCPEDRFIREHCAVRGCCCCTLLVSRATTETRALATIPCQCNVNRACSLFSRERECAGSVPTSLLRTGFKPALRALPLCPPARCYTIRCGGTLARRTQRDVTEMERNLMSRMHAQDKNRFRAVGLSSVLILVRGDCQAGGVGCPPRSA